MGRRHYQIGDLVGVDKQIRIDGYEGCAVYRVTCQKCGDERLTVCQYFHRMRCQKCSSKRKGPRGGKVMVPGAKHGNWTWLRRGKSSQHGVFSCAFCGKEKELWLSGFYRGISPWSCGCTPHPNLHNAEGVEEKRYTFQGETLTLAAWARRIGISRYGLALRLQRGIPLEEALTKPPLRFRRQDDLEWKSE